MATQELPTAHEPDKGAPAGPNLLAVRMNGTAPFLSYPDVAEDCMKQAHAMLLALSNAYEGAADAMHTGVGDSILLLNPQIIANTLEGIASLIALAQFGAEADRGQQS